MRDNCQSRVLIGLIHLDRFRSPRVIDVDAMINGVTIGTLLVFIRSFGILQIALEGDCYILEWRKMIAKNLNGENFLLTVFYKDSDSSVLKNDTMAIKVV